MVAAPEPNPSAFSETWRRFASLERTLGADPGAIDRWRRGRERYAVWALRVEDRTVARRMAAVAEKLEGVIVAVAPRDAHVTTWVAGFRTTTPMLEDDVAEEVIAAQREAVARVRSPRLLVGAPNAFASCAFLEVHDPHRDLAALRVALGVPGAREVRFARYRPHITVGRFAGTRAAAPIARSLGRLRAREDLAAPTTIDRCAVELIELDARDPDRLTTVWRAPHP